jgi:hypothetical protein
MLSYIQFRFIDLISMLNLVLYSRFLLFPSSLSHSTMNVMLILIVGICILLRVGDQSEGFLRWKPLTLDVMLTTAGPLPSNDDKNSPVFETLYFIVI